jgi:hypothetical protein
MQNSTEAWEAGGQQPAELNIFFPCDPAIMLLDILTK